jgi:hypothetical protein
VPPRCGTFSEPIQHLTSLQPLVRSRTEAGYNVTEGDTAGSRVLLVSKLSQSEEQVMVKHVLQTMSLTVAFDIICRRSFGIICRQRARRPPPGQSAQPGRPPLKPSQNPIKMLTEGAGIMLSIRISGLSKGFTASSYAK